MKTSDETKDVVAALAAVQSQMIIAAFDSVNPAFKRGTEVSKYAGYTSIRKLVDPPLKEAGVLLLQPVRIERPERRVVTETITTDPERGTEVATREYLYDDPAVIVTTRLWHAKSGQFLEEELAMPADRLTAQAIVSARTYAMRTSLSAFLAIATGEDDDGNAASGDPDKPAKKDKPKDTAAPTGGTRKASPDKASSVKQHGLIKATMAQLGMGDADKVMTIMDALGLTTAKRQAGLKAYGIESMATIAQDEMRRIRDGVEGDAKRTGLLKALNSAQASALIDKLKEKTAAPKEDEAPPADAPAQTDDVTAAVAILESTMTACGADPETVESLSMAFFKTKDIPSLSAENIIKLAEHVQKHMEAKNA